MGERPGGPPGPPEEVPPPRDRTWRREASGETPGYASETRPPMDDGHDTAQPSRSPWDWLKRASHVGKGGWAVSTIPDAWPRPLRQIPPKQKEDYEPHTLSKQALTAGLSHSPVSPCISSGRRLDLRYRISRAVNAHPNPAP